ncbi:MAG: aminodeoxychorismate/anthranilate synthase component II [Candidatus Omnitrophica bacterium]|jgi:anthranilate synthase component 2|nr:aminodeoxychorismate/anthranilate synthase component II [Candidatus Omnitrophota bacterium]
MILMIDNYDSFTYNLVQYLAELGANVLVYRNDKITLEEINKLKPAKIVISPGPGRPENAGISVEVIRNLAGKIPILGVCLGHQAIAYSYGAKITAAKNLMHGKTSMIYHNGKDIFKKLSNPFEATRYHSLVACKDTMPECLSITAWTKDKEIMGLAHNKYPVFGVQFHPESILTKQGKKLLENFLKI